MDAALFPPIARRMMLAEASAYMYVGREAARDIGNPGGDELRQEANARSCSDREGTSRSDAGSAQAGIGAGRATADARSGSPSSQGCDRPDQVANQVVAYGRAAMPALPGDDIAEDGRLRMTTPHKALLSVDVNASLDARLCRFSITQLYSEIKCPDRRPARKRLTYSANGLFGKVFDVLVRVILPDNMRSCRRSDTVGADGIANLEFDECRHYLVALDGRFKRRPDRP